MTTQVDPKFDVAEDQNSILKLTQFALLGGDQEGEILQNIGISSSNSNVKNYVKWLFGNDDAFNGIKESSKPWFQNIAKYSSLYCLVAAGYGYRNVKYRFPVDAIRQKFMRIGMWPTNFKDAGKFKYDNIEPSFDPLSKVSEHSRSFRPDDINAGIVWINLFSLYPDITRDIVNCSDITTSALHLEDEKQRHRLAANLIEWELITKTLNPSGDQLVQFLINVSKLYRYSSYDTLRSFSEPSNFSDDQLVRLIYAGFDHLPYELGLRGVRLPKDLRHFEQKPEGSERDESKDEISFKIRMSWVYGVRELAKKHILELLSSGRYGSSNLNQLKFLEVREIDYIVHLFKEELRPFMRAALMDLLCEKEIRIYSKDKPLELWIISTEEARSFKYKYMDAAAFITYYNSPKKR